MWLMRLTGPINERAAVLAHKVHRHLLVTTVAKWLLQKGVHFLGHFTIRQLLFGSPPLAACMHHTAIPSPAMSRTV